ncbi:host attachment protein [Alloalcanivorax profundimaris]|uniref:Host attachment protein n=1 Tax=Alloalcanivorax profundimaris TaxID=2735259 RepID=A0ABS0AST7_9GAMM|nr:host attachment protein [Alloalcanivorax profundimaris]MBM1142842.1 host attachment protein [Alcanivorax sp. ZXX171]MCQ6262927.1 host attachment protein [Alcanivorax sp. MM125-6]UWN51722.1 hypothetical protein ASALC70_03955 [Alcanivorax sp. ALC70]MBF1801204.1 host attachment protein [Alloalcanivorax profundimaris]MBF5056677.1 hypothetical protein [Alloalcanivorax profundimaris]
MTTYVIASNAAHARVFAHQVGRIREIDHLDHPESQAHAGDLRTGEGGKEGSGALHGNPRATGNQQATSDKHAAFFAKEVASYMKAAHDKGGVDDFILIAEPRFLGTLRDKLDDPTKEVVIREVDKDLTKQSVNDIKKAAGIM